VFRYQAALLAATTPRRGSCLGRGIALVPAPGQTPVLPASAVFLCSSCAALALAAPARLAAEGPAAVGASDDQARSFLQQAGEAVRLASLRSGSLPRADRTIAAIRAALPQQPVRRGNVATARRGPAGLVTIDLASSERRLRLYARGSAGHLWQTELQAAPGDHFYGEGLLSLVPEAPPPSNR
jgi:hypothetical protein